MEKYISKVINGEELYYLKDSEARANLIDKSEKGAASGVATLDENGKVPSSQLPEYDSGVSKITVGETEYYPIDGNVTIPAYPTELPASDVSEWAKASTKPSYTKSEVGLGNVTNDAQVKRTEMGAASGVATLDSTGKIPSSQLPSYVDDVLEYNTKSDFPATGETGKIYIDKATNISWRWGGTDYVEISPSIALGETSSTAYAGDKGKALADKLAGIEEGAEANVQSDWNQTNTSADDFIKNKPTIPTVNNGKFSVKGAGTEVASTTANASAASSVDIVAGSNVTVTPDATNGKITIAANDTTYVAGTGVTISERNNAINITYGSAAETACQGNDSRLSNARPASDVSAWAKASSKPSYAYSEIGYTVNAISSSGGSVSLAGTTPLHVVTLTGNVSALTLSTNPAAGHSCHVIFTSTAKRTVAIAHNATNRVCPEAKDVSLTVPANGYVEIDFLSANNKIYVRGV